MHYWQNPYLEWHSELPDTHRLYICRLRNSRNRARIAGVAEILTLLNTFGAIALVGGPYAEQRGVCWIGIPEDVASNAERLFSYLGYAQSISTLHKHNDGAQLTGNPVKWRGNVYEERMVYVCDEEQFRNRAPDRRRFMLEQSGGEVVPVIGYRGDGGESSRRGLAPEDARLLVNLATPQEPPTRTFRLLDAFAGVGGIVYEALDHAYEYDVYSGDIDPKVQYGLKNFGATHFVLDATHLPFRNSIFDAISVELPFHKSAHLNIPLLMDEFKRTLAAKGRLSIMGVEWQQKVLDESADARGFHCALKTPLDRKGTDVVVSAWSKE